MSPANPSDHNPPSALELRRHLDEAGVTFRAPPEAPTTCCGRGCNGCVWESFYLAEDWWKEQAVKALQAKNVS